MNKFHIITFGCQMNAHDSEKIAGMLESNGFSESAEPEYADIIVINTCSIRQKAEDKFYSQVGRLKALKQKNPALKIAVAGCIAQQEGNKIVARAPHVDMVIGPQNIHCFRDLSRIIDSRILTMECKDVSLLNLTAHRRDPIKALVNIMYGCNNFCSYCVVPYTRGREKSRASHDILNEIRQLASQGYKEVMLLGQNVNSYRDDVDFAGLLNMIEHIEGIKRIRFMTSHPKDLSDELIDCIVRLTKVCEHIHLPLQSGSTRILKLMNRRYSYEDYLNKVIKLRSKAPDICITTDIIAGFPQETDKDHEDTLNALREIQFDGIFSFKYSMRPETKASTLEGHLSEDIKGMRLQEIISLQDEITEGKNKLLVGKTEEILVDSISDKEGFNLIGRNRGNKIVYINTDKTIRNGDIINVIIKTSHRHSLEADY